MFYLSNRILEVKDKTIIKTQFLQHVRDELDAKNKHNRKSIRRIALSYGITDKSEVKEFTELAIVLNARNISLSSLSVDEKYWRIVELYQGQVNIFHRTSQSILLQQYSTPAPISFLAGIFTNAEKNISVFEPSAGNGLLTIAANPSRVIVNEIDDLRRSNLSDQGYRQVLNQDATQPFKGFEKKFDSVLTNKGLSGVLTAEEMATRKLDLLNFFSFWNSLFGNPAKNFTMMFHGEPHNGKTIFLLKLAQYLAENFGDVLYVSSEEFASPTMTQKVNEFLNPLPTRLHFAENLKDPNLSNYQFIILDSVNDLGLKINEYKELRKENPDTAFIFILQHTKAGDFKGGKDWEHIAEIAGEVHKGVVNVTKNRYAPKSSLDFFTQFGIQWQEPINKQKLKVDSQ